MRNVNAAFCFKAIVSLDWTVNAALEQSETTRHCSEKFSICISEMQTVCTISVVYTMKDFFSQHLLKRFFSKDAIHWIASTLIIVLFKIVCLHFQFAIESNLALNARLSLQTSHPVCWPNIGNHSLLITHLDFG